MEAISTSDSVVNQSPFIPKRQIPIGDTNKRMTDEDEGPKEKMKRFNTIIIKNCKIPILVKDYNNKGILSSNSSQRSNSKRMAIRAIYLEVIKIKKNRRSTKSAVKQQIL